MTDRYTHELGELFSTVCDPALECPISTYCNNIDQVCIENSLIQQCTGDVGCKKVQLKCESYESVCIQANKTCQKNCTCLSHVQVCKKWASKCIEPSTICKNIIITKNMKDCLKITPVCETKDDLDAQCVMNCDWNNKIYQKAEKKYEIYMNAYNISQSELKGFDDINKLLQDKVDIPDIIQIKSIIGTKKLTESGMGSIDINIQSNIKIISIESSGLMEYNLDIIWSFLNDIDNQEELLRKSKAAIIQLSDGSLTVDLIEKSEKEIIEENINYS